MCGIAGIASLRGVDPAERAALPAMMNRLAHRGPDEAGCYESPDVLLGHRRLSVIDLETGRQPLRNEDGSVRAVVNGEFYNFLELREDLKGRGHHFRTTSDSECLLHLYEDHGDGCVDHLHGMFGFALWDERRRRLLLARDRLGVKPVYYTIDDGRLIFASELKAILAAPRVQTELNPAALIDYLTYGFIPSPATIFKQIYKLAPGHLLTFQDGRARVRCYWDLNHAAGAPEANESLDAVADGLWSQLDAATRCRLLADVPIGAFLSGGIDSCAVVATMSRLARDRTVTLTCGFDQRGFDERGPARETADLLGTDHHDALVIPDVAGIVDVLAWHFDEPFADASAIPTYALSGYARRFVTVALSGDGGDEILAGYRRYRFDQYEERVRRRLSAGFRRRVFGPLADLSPRRPWMPRFLRGAATFRNLAVDAPTAHALSISTLAPMDALGLVRPDLAEQVRGYDPLDHARGLYRRCRAPDHLSKCQYVDIRLGLAEGILTKVDRASMAHGLEIRSPMLDHRFVESAWRIPPRLRTGGRRGKLPLRRALSRHVHPSLADRPKSGFEVPMDAWFRGPLRERFEDGPLSVASPARQWLSAAAIDRAWREHQSGRIPRGATLWKLLMLDAWGSRFAGTPTESPPARERLACIR